MVPSLGFDTRTTTRELRGHMTMTRLHPLIDIFQLAVEDYDQIKHARFICSVAPQ
jgi:hypothetical protein